MSLFSERGFAGTSFRDVAERSGISVGLIQYHFGTKTGLYDAVREHALRDYVEAQEPQFALPTEDLDTFIDRGLRRYFRFFEEHASWMTLTLWAAIEGDDRAWPGEHALMDRLVERWFAGLTEKALRRGSHRSVRELQKAIQEYLDASNDAPHPFVWTKTADRILAKIGRFAQAALEAQGKGE